MNQLEAQYQEILHTLDKLLANLGLMLEDYDVEYLTQADLYIEIFKIMFPVLEPVLNADFGEDITDEELIQYLIDVLAKDIIKMDLGHIRGELIAQGDAKNILNFLQLLFEISNMVVEKDDDKKEKRSKKSKKLVKSSANSADQTSNDSERSSLELNQKYNSVQGINAEFSNSSMAAESQREEASEVEAEEAAARYYEEQARLQNKMVFDQHQQMKGMKGDSRGNSRSVSRISEVSKSKESSEYERGMKKLSQKFDDNPAVLQVKSLVAESGQGKRGSYTSEDIREMRGENGEDELEEEEEEVTENEYEQEQQDAHEGRVYTNENEEFEQEGHEGEEEYEEEEEEEEEGQDDNGEQRQYYQETNGDDEIIEEDDGFSEHMIKKISKEEVGDDLEYYSNDPINYNPLGGKQQSRHSHEENRARAVQSVEMQHRQMEQEQGEEEDEQEYEEGQEEEGEVEEHSQQQFYEEEGEESQYQQEQDEQEQLEEEEEEIVEEIDPRYAEYREEMEEVAEEEYEEDTENAEPNHALYPQGYYHPEQAQQIGKKPKGKGKAKKASKKKSPKAKAVEDFKKPKVEYRPLRPATAGMKRPQTAGSSKGNKVSKVMAVRSSSGRKSNESTSSRSKKMAHSKSERRLGVEDQEQSRSQSGVQEDNSEDNRMEPKEYSQGNSQVPSQHGHAGEYSGIQEQQELEEQGYLEQTQQVSDGNVFRILSDNVMRVKENLRENRAVEDIPFDDEQTVKMIRQQKEQYKQYLKDFVKDHQIREKKYDQMRTLGEKNFHKKMRSEKIRDQTLRVEFENQQKSLYYKMRDEKVNYLRRIHKTIFELEKKRIIDEKKEYMEFRKTRNVEACNMIASIKNQYKHKLSILRENNANQQHERKIASEAQRTFIKTLENELRMDQMKEVERLKDKWRLEKERFDMMIKDEGFLEQKVMQLYKKGVF